MNADTITCLNFVVHSLVIGAAAWLLIRFIIRDALRRCILANLAVLMCLYTPFNISFQDLLPKQAPVPVWTPIQDTFKADWRITVTPATAPAVVTTQTPAWNVNDLIKTLRRLSWLITAALLLRLALQCLRVQRWAWRLRHPSIAESKNLPADTHIRVFDHAGTPCVAGWFFPVIAVPASAFETLTPLQWRWLLRHEGEHLRCHDTVCVFLQNIVRSFLWWNPFAHALIEEYARAREEACDAAAVGDEPDHTAYADFLLTWAAQSAPQSSCVMPISHSRPARRLKVRLVALMEARGVRKKLGALFVLACAAFAIIAPLVAASFGIATASAQQPKADNGTMCTRAYRVAPDFLTSKAAADPVVFKTARELLEHKGVPFPPDSSAIFNPVTSQLIVRNTNSSLELIERIIDGLHTRAPLVYFTCKFIQADQHFGTHESILTPPEMQDLVRSMSQTKGVDLMNAPSVTTKLDQEAVVEVMREVPPKVAPNGKPSGDMKFVGLRIKLLAKTSVQAKSLIETKVEFATDPDSPFPWLPQNDKAADWDKIKLHTVASKTPLSSGETLLLHLKTAIRPVTVLITATALKPDGTNAGNFAATLEAPPAREGRNMPEMVRRVYRVPAGFGDGLKPVDYLKKNGITFPQGAGADLADGKLTVGNTKENHELIEGLVVTNLAAGIQKDGLVKLSVHVAEVSIKAGKALGKWDPDKSTWQRDVLSKAVPIREAPPEIRNLFAVTGVMTPPQFKDLTAAINKEKVSIVSLPDVTKKTGVKVNFEMPAQFGGKPFGVRPKIEQGGALSVFVELPDLVPEQKKRVVTEVTVWDGQTVMLGGVPAENEDVTRVIFVTATLVDPAGEPVKK